MPQEVVRAKLPSARGTNFYDTDFNLQFEVGHRVAPKDVKRSELWLRELGRTAGDELDRMAARADTNPPRLQQYDPDGSRVDRIENDPVCRAMETIAYERFALAASSHKAGILGWPTTVPHVVKLALSYLFVQAEFGTFSGVATTDAAARVLRRFASNELKTAFLPRLTSTHMKDLWRAAVLVTERDAGSDVGEIATTARRVGDFWRLYGEKWFCNCVDAEVFLAAARPEGGRAGIEGLALFLIPRVLPDGRRNNVAILRLKEKLGSRSIATGEVVLDGALAYQVADVSTGAQQLLDVNNSLRLSNAMRSAALMRRAYYEAFLHARERRAFGQPLIGLPLLRKQLVDLLLEVEAATAFLLFTAQVLDHADTGDEPSQRLVRTLIPIAKQCICDRARNVVSGAMDVRGANGYVEEWVNPRLVRDVHLGSLWNGTSNMAALDIARSLREDRTADLLHRALTSLLETCRNAGVAELARQLAGMSQKLFARTGEVAALDRARRDPLTRTLGEALYALTATTLLTQEAQWQLAETGSARKLLVARLFAARELGARDPLAVSEIALSNEQADALFNWTALNVAAANVAG